MRKAIVTAIGMMAVLGAAVASAEDVKIKAPAPMPAPTPEPRIIAPELLYERRPGDESHYPGPSVPYDPAFIRPFTRTVETAKSTGRIGLSGWTAPQTPIGTAGPGQHESPGWLSFGFTWTWGGPPPAARPAGGDEPAPSVTR